MRAALARVRADAADAGERARQVGVVEHDRRRLAAELEEHLLHRAGGARHDAPAGRGRAGERDQVDARVGREHLAEHVVGPATTFTTPGGMSVSSAISRPSIVARPRRVGRGLQHDGAAGGERGPELAEVQVEREVPRRDRADDAGRLAPDAGGGSPCP